MPPTYSNQTKQTSPCNSTQNKQSKQNANKFDKEKNQKLALVHLTAYGMAAGTARQLCKEYNIVFDGRMQAIRVHKINWVRILMSEIEQRVS